MDIIVILSILLLLKAVKPRKDEPGELSAKALLPIRGICAAVVVMHHIAQRAELDTEVLFPLFAHVGCLCVAVFFAISGYALSFQYASRPDYLKGFLKKRYILLLFPYFAATLGILVISLPDMFAAGTNPGTWLYLRIYSMLRKGITFLPFSWYVEIISVLYLLFFLVYRFCGHRKQLRYLLCFLGSVALMLLCRKLQYGVSWYNTIFSFLLGIAYYDYSESRYYVRMPKHLGVLLSFLLFILLFHVQLRHYSPLLTNFSACAVAIFVFQLSRAVRFDSRVLDYLGSRSYEIYLCQGLPISILEMQGVKEPLPFFVITVVFTMLLAEILHRITQKVCHRLRL